MMYSQTIVVVMWTNIPLTEIALKMPSKGLIGAIVELLPMTIDETLPESSFIKINANL